MTKKKVKSDAVNRKVNQPIKNVTAAKKVIEVKEKLIVEVESRLSDNKEIVRILTKENAEVVEQRRKDIEDFEKTHRRYTGVLRVARETILLQQDLVSRLFEQTTPDNRGPFITGHNVKINKILRMLKVYQEDTMMDACCGGPTAKDYDNDPRLHQ